MSAARESSPLFERVDLDSADAVMDELLHYRGARLWDHHGEEKGWLFRGQADAAWGLTPAAMRPNALCTYVAAQAVPYQRSQCPVDERLQCELSMVIDFAAAADRAGFALPFDSHEIRAGTIGRDPIAFPEARFRGLFALAQHYGVPTRLLDWTRRPLVAAYFGAAGAAEAALMPYKQRRVHPTFESDRCAIWALAERGLHCLWSNDGGPEFNIEVVTAPSAVVPNLGAQAGVFTLVCCRSTQAAELDPPDLDQLFRDQTLPEKEPLRWSPTMYQFTFPRTQAGRLLYLLSLLDISAATVYPGLASVEQRLFERNMYPLPAFRADD